jgi:uncharacterized membrane protein YjfL (UPF0719 family)
MWITYFYFAGVGLGSALFMILSSLLLRGLFGPKLTKSDLLAARLVDAGHLFAVFLVTASVVRHCVKGQDVFADLTWIAVFGGLSVFLLEAVSGVGVRLLIGHRLPEEISRGNIAAGLAAGGHYAATGVIASSCLYGDSFFGLEISLLFFFVGQASLHLLVILFRALTSYEDDKEILEQNLAAALSYAGVMLALSIIVGKAAGGEFKGFAASFTGYGLALLYGLLFYPIRQFVLQGLVLRSKLHLRGGVLDKAIVARDAGYASIEVAAYLGAALLLVSLSE